MTDVMERLRAALAEHYAVDRELGRGGMATVYLARDLKHGRPVAIKVLRPTLAESLGPDRFLREIRIASRLVHPNILPVHDSGEAEGLLFYVMPHVGGENLRDLIRREGQLPVEVAVRIAEEVAQGLTHAHRENVVHRDIKPENILLESGHAVIADFGLARAIHASALDDLSSAGLAVGTPPYMSPEQATAGDQIDGRSDVYSLGCVVYEMLAGEPPFTGPSAQAIAAKHLNLPPPPLRTVRPSVPTPVVAAINRALEKVPADRFQTAEQFSKALTASDTSGSGRPLRRALRWGAAALLVGLGYVGWRATGDSNLPRQPAWVLVADFQGPPDLGNLADAIRDLVSAELDQSRLVATMPRQQLTAVIRDAGLPDSVRLTAEVAQELALRSSVRAILTGSVQSVRPGQYSIVIRVIDADGGNVLLSATEAATDSDLVSKAQGLGRQVRRGLGERRAEIESNKPLTQVATPSFEAYRKYVDALSLGTKADVDGSNRLLREALALDSGFASAWAAMSVNYAVARDVDSSRLALIEALKRPSRLNTALRYKLEGEAAYRLHYDLPAAVRWYELHLEHAPQSLSGHNNRGVYLSSMGRYEEALEEFRTAARIDPFGPAHAQPQIFNETATLLALGRPEAAREASRKLTSSFAEYAALLQATAEGQWRSAESLAAGPATDPATPAWLRAPAVTLWAGAVASRGALASAEQILRRAEAGAQRPSSHWYRQALLVLTLVSGRRIAPPTQVLVRDTTPGGILLRGLMFAGQGDTHRAGRALNALHELPAIEQLRLGDGPRFLEARIAATEGRWHQVRRLLGPAALRGENDGSSPAQVSSLVTRWLLADAYEEAGLLDSAAAYFDLAIAPTRVPFSHLALRGLAYPFAERRLAILYGKIGQAEVAQERWKAFAMAFTTPDPDLKQLMVVEVGRRRNDQSIVR